MLNRTLASLVVVGLVAPAAADPRTVQVLKTQGKLDATTRAQVDAAILKFARLDATATPGDITFAEAAAAVGCQPEVVACREEVRAMLAVDEVIYATAEKQRGGIDVTVYRIGAGGTSREMTTTIAPGQPADQLDGIAPLFMTTRPSSPAPEPTPEPGAAPTAPAAAPLENDGGDSQPAAEPSPTPGQPQVDAPTWRHRRLELTGMIGGGAMVFVGLMCWGGAADIQGQIDDAPTATRAQLDALQDLEDRGDTYSALGNVLFLGGAIIGGISTYYFIKDRRRARSGMTAQIMPTVLDHGAGFAIGGTL